MLPAPGRLAMVNVERYKGVLFLFSIWESTLSDAVAADISNLVSKNKTLEVFQ